LHFFSGIATQHLFPIRPCTCTWYGDGYEEMKLTTTFLIKNFLQEKAVEATKQEKERKEEKT
jgi:hypothetical protein